MRKRKALDMKLELILAGMLIVAATTRAQPEQWLEYHTSDDGRVFHRLDLTTNPPPGVALPKLNAPPFFVRWKTPMDPAGGRWLCFDRTRKSGLYDLLFIDSTGNGRLDDKKPVLARLESSGALFPATPVIFKSADGPITYHLVFRFYQFGNNQTELLMASGGWYEGTVNFGGVKKHVTLIDGNGNGTFNDMAPDPYDSDRVQIDGDKAGERFLGKMLEVNGKFFNVEVARDGSFLKVQPAENVVLGPVRVPANISEFIAFGPNGYFVREPTNGEFTLPAGQYRMFRWTINRKDQNGAAWTLSGHNFPKTATFEVAADKPAALDIGEPVKAVLKANEQANRQVTFSLSFVGHQQESIEMLRGNQRPAGPKLTLANADGSLCGTSTFEFG
jgi:hypothetical protein